MEIQINLPANIAANDTLAALLAKAGNKNPGSCKDSFIVDAIDR